MRQRQDFILNSQISFTRGGENMEQPSLLLQLSSSLHQLNMAEDHTGGEEERKGKGAAMQRGEEKRRRREDLRKGERKGGIRKEEKEGKRRRAGRLLAGCCNPE